MTESELVCSWPRVFIPEACRGVDVVIGIDEAGRGPVLGSLVYTAALWPVSMHEHMCTLGFDDSKQLKEGVRDTMFDKIRENKCIGWVIAEISAPDISRAMLRPQPTSLNALSFHAVIKILETIRDVENPPGIGDIFIDTVGDPEFYKSTLTHALGANFANFIIEKKADATYRVVSAASIIAKVTRDTLMKEFVWAEPSVKLERDYGSGYPGDENCVRWLEKARKETHPVFGFPNIVRFSWSTSREALKGKATEVLWECDEDDTLGGASMTSFLTGSVKRPKRSAYFLKKKMKIAVASDLLA